VWQHHSGIFRCIYMSLNLIFSSRADILINYRSSYFVFINFPVGFLILFAGRVYQNCLQRNNSCWALFRERPVSIEDISWLGDWYCCFVPKSSWFELQNSTATSIKEISFPADPGIRMWTWQYWRRKSCNGTSTSEN